MAGKPKKPPRQKDPTESYFSGDFDEDKEEGQERFGKRSKHQQENKTAQTTLTRLADEASNIELEKLPIGEVVQVHSLFLDVEHESAVYLCVGRKTLYKTAETRSIVVGDRVRFLKTGGQNDAGRPEGVIEQILPRKTLLTRSDSFKGIENHPIVANAEQMLIVASVLEPDVKWGLVDRMIIAAQGGGLAPIICLNKIDLADGETLADARAALDHYRKLGLAAIETSVQTRAGLDETKDVLRGKTTVLAGHSGVGKSSLITAVQPSIDIRVGEISGYTGKGRHTTTSARRYLLEGAGGGLVIDTPGVKMFGLWGLSPDNLIEFFPDVADGSAPEWREESYERIRASLKPTN